MFFFKGDRVADVDVLVGCFSALRRQAIDQVGMLDESFYMYGDDLDWCRAACDKAAGVSSSILERKRFITSEPAPARKDPVRYALLQQQSVLRYWRKYHSRAGVAGIRGLMFLRLMTRWTTGLLKRVAMPSKRDEGRDRMKESSRLLAGFVRGFFRERARRRPLNPAQAVMPRQ